MSEFESTNGLNSNLSNRVPFHLSEFILEENYSCGLKDNSFSR